MFVALEATVPCTCGYAIRLVMTGTVRINKHSVRITGPLLGALEYSSCPECGTEVPRGGDIPRSEYKLMAADAEKVAEYRQRRWGVPVNEAPRAAG